VVGVDYPLRIKEDQGHPWCPRGLDL
jgi:hypothetical protein